MKYAFHTGYKDSYALLHQLPDINKDFIRCFIEPSKKLEIIPQIDKSKVFSKYQNKQLESVINKEFG